MKNKKYLYQFSSVILILAIWFLIGFLQLINPVFLPKLESTFSSLIDYMTDKEFYTSFFATIYRALMGLVLSILFGVPMGLLLGKSKKLYDFFDIPIEFLRAIPASALFPLFILFFGFGDISKIAIVFYGCSLIIIINTIYGVAPNSEKQARINMMKTLGASNYQIFSKVIFRDALPNISSGIRISISLAFVLVVVTEMFLSANDGIGKMIYDMYLQYKIPEMYALILILGFIGFGFNKLYVLLESKYLFWNK